ncbi:translation elongation factor Ts [Candidatus Shapirobacteria bacterium CG03_land_8_20_14_0_80_40_19]|uniref:Elongation factor Ts n=3 Tax=Candidatus Shapironibacteriota TaxID=1752721 RepID=A0A2M7BGL2_9BACT|nr:MAG: translation elongation factor Ts [Candidatus Shapirobacteria bacterium CG11_big_fil_rev_8_21_14_0_20_40_12]PIV02200.1 MAG: translation elongation factor Ts [Candidatus Shapirobacteria bacterium CG03_land_8_20_14_0_80_40_19]PJC28595.1 MAG: translation elongation factor Ts [Candidatus Shapirobacteria bacterium CG_4_9_14_0_2_um_filter_40_11]
MTITIDQIKSLRDQVGAGILECRKALEEAGGDEKKALQILKKRGVEIAEKKQERETKQGLLETYSHQGGKVVSVVELLCETDFVARNEEFQDLAHELAMQVAAMSPKSVEGLLEQEYIRDSSKKVSDLLNNLISKIGENIKIGRIARYSLGE